MKTLTIYGKCSDLCVATLVRKDGSVVEREDYPPDIHKLCGGDDIQFTIDIATGSIVGWNQQSIDDIAEAFAPEEDEEDPE